MSISADNNLGTAPGSATAAAITLNGGTLQSTATSMARFTAESRAVTCSALTLTLNANRGVTLGSSNGTIDSSSGTLTIGGVGHVTISGTIGTTTGTLTKDGNGTLTLSTANTFSGGTTVNAGVVSISSDGNLGAVPGSATAASITLNGGTLQSTAGLTLSANRGITLGASHGTIDASSGTLTYGGIIAGSGGLTKSGSGTLTLSGANTYTGGTTVSAGTLTLGASDRLANNGALTISSSATFNLNGHNETIGSLAGAGNVTLGAANLIAGEANTSTTYSGVISGTGGLTKRGTGTLILSGNNTYSGRHSGRCRRPAHFGQHCQ